MSNFNFNLINLFQVFLKAPVCGLILKNVIFKSEALNIPLPPKPILTRWDTWLMAAS